MSDLTQLTRQKRDFTIAIFLIASISLHLGAIFMAAILTPVEPDLKVESVELEIEGAPDQPPPLGTNDEETGPPPEPEEQPTPPPVPEDTPPPPPVPSDFDVPEDKPTPAPTPKPAAPKPSATPKKESTPGPAASPKVNPNARVGAIKGVDASRGGVAGGTGGYKSSGGGGKADFSSTPNMSIPYNLRQRLSGFKGSAAASISYSNGQITDVSITRSSGSAPLDSQIIRHVRGNYRVKAGRSGKANLPIGIKL